VQARGVDGLIIAAMLSGIVMAGVGYLCLGSIIKFMPYPVTVGFTAGVAIVIFASQIKDLLGLTLSGREPGALVPKLAALMQVLPTVRMSAVAAGLLTFAIIGLCRRFRPHWPGMLIAVVAVSALGYTLGMPLDTIGSRFGGIPQTLQAPSLPAISFDSIAAVVPAALSFALLGSIESLLSATVADSMTGARHRSNAELVAQGLANIGSALFGGFYVTGVTQAVSPRIDDPWHPSAPGAVPVGYRSGNRICPQETRSLIRRRLGGHAAMQRDAACKF
jgi:sulfate permease, SulP family